MQEEAAWLKVTNGLHKFADKHLWVQNTPTVGLFYFTVFYSKGHLNSTSINILLLQYSEDLPHVVQVHQLRHGSLKYRWERQKKKLISREKLPSEAQIHRWPTSPLADGHISKSHISAHQVGRITRITTLLILGMRRKSATPHSAGPNIPTY